MRRQHDHHCWITAEGHNWWITGQMPGAIFLARRADEMTDYVSSGATIDIRRGDVVEAVLDVSGVDFDDYCAAAVSMDYGTVN